ncbi:hypothetical protein Tco_0019865 [Tanacetum coccineum]
MLACRWLWWTRRGLCGGPAARVSGACDPAVELVRRDKGRECARVPCRRALGVLAEVEGGYGRAGFGVGRAVVRKKRMQYCWMGVGELREVARLGKECWALGYCSFRGRPWGRGVSSDVRLGRGRDKFLELGVVCEWGESGVGWGFSVSALRLQDGACVCRELMRGVGPASGSRDWTSQDALVVAEGYCCVCLLRSVAFDRRGWYGRGGWMARCGVSWLDQVGSKMECNCQVALRWQTCVARNFSSGAGGWAGVVRGGGTWRGWGCCVRDGARPGSRRSEL